MNAPLSSQQQEHAFLARLGERVRAWRTEHGMTRKQLSVASGVSERYLAQLEAGQGNMSVLLLRKVARAMGVDLPAPRRPRRATGFGWPSASRPPRPARRGQVDARREARRSSEGPVRRARSGSRE